MKFRADLARFDSRVLDDRITLYFWWEMTARETYPDFFWGLRPQDLEYLHQLDNESLIARHPRALTFWLGSTAPSVLDTRHLTETLLDMQTVLEEADLQLPWLIKMIVGSRDDLSRAFDLGTLTGYLNCVDWWEVHGQEACPRVAWIPPVVPPRLLEPVDAGALPFPRFLALIATERPDLRSAFDLNSFIGRLACLSWWQEHGYREYTRFVWSPPPVSGAMLEPEGELREDRPYIPHFIALLIAERPDLQSAFVLDSFTGRLGCLSWWLEHGQQQYRAIKWVPPVPPASLFEMEWAARPNRLPIPRFLGLILNERDDLRAAGAGENFIGRLNALSWWIEHGQQQYPAIRWEATPLPADLFEMEPGERCELPLLPCFLRLIWDERPDLQAAYDMNCFGTRLGYLRWWDEHGKHDYPAIKWVPAGVPGPLFEMDWGTHPDWLPVPRFLQAILDERPDLQALCPQNSFIGRLNLLSWWVEHGQPQYPTIHWVTAALPAALFDTEPGKDGKLPRLPRFLTLIHNEQPGLQAAFDLDNFSARVSYLQWWEDTGQNAYHAVKWSARSLADELATLDDDRPDHASPLPLFLTLIANDRPDLHVAFDLATDTGREELAKWWNVFGNHEYPLLGKLRVQREDSAAGSNVSAPACYHANVEHGYEFGVNVIGFPQGVLGLGEDARMAARVFQLTSTPVVLITAPMSGPAKLDNSVDHLLSDDLKYGISLICLPAPEMVRLALEGGRKLIDAPTHKIGAWPWELPHWPSAFGKVHEMVDEIWAQSRFVQSVYRRLGDTPVHHMPMAVEVPAPQNPERARFGLPSGEFLFYLMFDGNSWLSRKNPLAGVRAFKEAFGESSSGVGLVIKAMNVRDEDPVWREVLSLASNDSRMHIVSERLSRQDTIDFMACCDAYISLHRSEGFGRVIAEAMALGQPVVATNFSGNVDFCDPDTAFLVDGELVPLRPGDYLFSEGQYWCDPDVSIAAQQLKRMIEDTPARKQIAQAGNARIQRDYSVEAVARAYQRRLSEITGVPST
ncbi:glycosyltransferase family 4 protein [Paraburkholderia fungorum]|nr:glycosyltransferase family 4 protein [Paraburkholderia fungorum]